MTLHVVYALGTGHVLGALAQTGADDPADAAALVGRALPLRVSLSDGSVATLPLSAGKLGVAAVDDEPGALTDPLAFGVELASEDKPKPELVRLAAWDDDVALAKDGITIKVQVPANRITPVVALISDEQDIHVLTGEIPAQQTQVKLPVTLTAGSEHGVLVLAAGWSGHLGMEKVT